MAQRRKKVSRRHGASRARPGGKPGYVWFFAGLFLGLALSGAILLKEFWRERGDTVGTKAGPSAAVSDGALIQESESTAAERGSRFDFFTVLPEMEVVVPEQELATEASPAGDGETETAAGSYILQAGSFRSMADADQLKARLALLGAQANIQVVTVNDVTWHRVRIGPVQGARRADELRRNLADHNIETLVLKDSP